MKPIHFLFFLIPIGVFSQNTPMKIIYGKIQNEALPVQGVFVSNLTTGEFSNTNREGVFSIKVHLGDTLSFIHLSFQTFSERVTNKMLSMDLVVIQVSDKVNTLDEVEVNAFPNINAVSLGILDHQPEQLTTNQRRLRTAGDFKPVHLLGLLGGSLPVDPIINKISGRTKRIKKLVKFDREEDYFDFILEHHKDFITSELEFSQEELNRFVYFLIDDDQIQTSIETENHAQLQYFIQDLALQYREDQSESFFGKS